LQCGLAKTPAGLRSPSPVDRNKSSFPIFFSATNAEKLDDESSGMVKP
jgi:hypothetical protein